MTTFTLDTNCIIHIDEDRPEAQYVRALADAHAAGTADVAIVAIAASENQYKRPRFTNFSQFEARLQTLGLDHLRLLYPMTYLGIAFLNRSTLASGPEVAFEKKIHQVLFPEIAFAYAEFEMTGKDISVWRNRKCDVQAYWSHLHARRDVFVTSDGTFHKETKKPRLIALADGNTRIMHPAEAAALL